MRFREITEADKKGKPKVTQAQIHAWAADASEKYDVPIQLVMHVLNKETGGADNPDYAANAVSNKGAGGVMQIMPGTAKDSNLKNVFDPRQNVYAGVKILGQHLKTVDGNHNSALAAYNSGGGTVNSYLTGTPLKVTQADGTVKTINPKGTKTADGVPPYRETQRYIYGKDDGKGNKVGGYDPNAVYDVAALKAALPVSTTAVAPTVKTLDPVAVGQAKIDKMPAYDRSKGEPVPPPSQSQVRAADNKIDAATPKPTPTPVTPPTQITNQPRDFRPAVPGPVPDALKTPNQIGNQPGGSTTPAPIVKAAPAPVVTPGGDLKRSSPEPVVSTPAASPSQAKAVDNKIAAVAPAPNPEVDPTGGQGRTGPTVAASKGLDTGNQLNKGPTILPTPAPTPAPTGDWKALAKANKIDNPDLIKPGQDLILPGGGKYTISKGDTLSGIASGNYKGSAPVTTPVVTTPVAPQPQDITADRLRTLSGNTNTLPSTAGPLPTIDLLNKPIKDPLPPPPVIKADAKLDNTKKPAVPETLEIINTRRYPFLSGL